MFSYVTVLSNWLLGYDRYQRIYSKNAIRESSFPNEFYVLKEDELDIGLNKAKKLVSKTAVVGDRILRIETSLKEVDVTKNTRNGLGWVYPDHKVPVSRLYLFEDGTWVEKTVEDVTAEAYSLHVDTLKEWQELRPLTLSFLPIAIACQASCAFCFSGSSISFEKKKRIKDFEHLEYWCRTASDAGAERFVITGGGEPTIMPFDEILEALHMSSKFFDKNVIISNGLFLSKLDEEDIVNRLKELKKAGLSVLSLSYHHYDPATNAVIMGMDTHAEKIMEAYSKCDRNEVPKLRIVCVLQKGGVDSKDEIQGFVNKALEHEIDQLCFKELYVASTYESLYSKKKENIYSRDHQVSLTTVVNFADENHLEVIKELPWGSPIYRYLGAKGYVDIAAYTEPSVGWERSNGIARSWNYMADNKCYASLEDESSKIIAVTESA
jgi:molybdenum cofactor biosynthesis enzyme MoaA